MAANSPKNVGAPLLHGLLPVFPCMLFLITSLPVTFSRSIPLGDYALSPWLPPTLTLSSPARSLLWHSGAVLTEIPNSSECLHIIFYSYLHTAPLPVLAPFVKS